MDSNRSSVEWLLAATHAAEPTLGHNTKIPKSIMTPDKVETRAGEVREKYLGVSAQISGCALTPNTRHLRPDQEQ